MIKLNELLKKANIENTVNKDIDIENIAYHSGSVKSNSLFVCIKGIKTDGHKYLEDAVKKGAVVAIVEEINKDVDIFQILVDDSRKALALISSAFYDFPAKSMKMIGITATNGKTTTSYMVNSILENFGFKTGLVGTVVIKADKDIISSELTTPQSLDLQSHLYNMKNKGVTHVTMEVSSSALELDRVFGIDYDIVAFNNISREHIDLHGSYENYFNIKSSLLKNADKGSFAVINMDSKEIASLADEISAEIISFGVQNKNADILCNDLDISTGRAEFTVEIKKEIKAGDTIYNPQTFNISLSVPGYHSVYNAMSAIVIGLLCEIPIDIIQKSFRSFEGVERRFEFIYEDDFKIIDDHFANSGNIDVTMKTLDYMDYKKLYLVYAIRGSRGPIVNSENANSIAMWAKKLNIKTVTATLSRDYTTSKDIVTDEELDVFMKIMEESNIDVNLYENLEDAVEDVLKKAEKDDAILLGGCQGMDYGANIALHKLAELKPGLSLEKLMEPLKNRVCGIE